MNNKEVYRNIIDKMELVLPKEWNKIVIGANIENSSYEVFFYVFVDNEEKAINGYDLPNIEEDKIDDLMDKIYEQLNELRLKDKVNWKTATIILNKNSIIDTEFGYDSIEDIYAFKTIWKYRYLNIKPLDNESYASKILNDYIENKSFY